MDVAGRLRSAGYDVKTIGGVHTRDVIYAREQGLFLGLIPYTRRRKAGLLTPHGIIGSDASDVERFRAVATKTRVLPPYASLLAEAFAREGLRSVYVEGGDYGGLLVGHVLLRQGERPRREDVDSPVARFIVEPSIARFEHGFTMLSYGTPTIKAYADRDAVMRGTARLEELMGEPWRLQE